MNRTFLALTAILVVLIFYAISNEKSRDKPSSEAATTPSDPISEQPRRGAGTAQIITKALPKQGARVEHAENQHFTAHYSVVEKPGDLALEATPAAENGSPEAMRELSAALKACSEADMGSDDEVQDKVARGSLGREKLDKTSGKRTTEPAARTADLRKQVRDSCRKIPREQAQQWLTWLERAAAAGDSRARAAYAWTALDEYKTDEDRAASADEYLRRRDAAYAFLQDSIASGDCGVNILNGFRKVSPDPVSAYIYQSIFLRASLAQLENRGAPRAVIDQQRAAMAAWQKNLAAAVPSDQLADADNTTSYIMQNYCGFRSQ